MRAEVAVAMVLGPVTVHGHGGTVGEPHEAKGVRHADHM